MMCKKLSQTTLLFVSLLLASCAQHQNQAPALAPETAKQATVKINLQETRSTLKNTNPIELATWWQSFHDPVLNTLMQTTTDKNFDIAIAYWQWQQSQAQAGVTLAAQQPEISANLQGNRQRSLSQNSDNDNASTRRSWNANVQARWQIDLWHQLQHSADAARAQMRASEAAYQGVYLSVLSQVADVYFQWQQLAQQKQLTEKNLVRLQAIEKNTQQRFQLGASNRLDWIQAQTERQQQALTLQNLAIEQYALQQQLQLLTYGADATVLLDNNTPAPAPFPAITLPEKLQVNLLERRPDILQARQQLLAAWSSEQAAKVAHLPTLDLLGGIGSASRIASDLFSSNSNTYQLNGNLAGILWQGDRFKSALAAADANTKQLHLAYQRTVLNAIFEVDLHLIQYQQHQQSIDQLRAMNALQQTALDIAQRRYDSGEDDLLSVLEAQRNLYNQRLALLTAETDQRRNLVKLYQALGGGWPSRSN